MEITLQHFDSCPSWETTDQHLQDLIDRLASGPLTLR
jgi:hypothetical protein